MKSKVNVPRLGKPVISLGSWHARNCERYKRGSASETSKILARKAQYNINRTKHKHYATLIA